MLKFALEALKEDTIATVGGIDDNDTSFTLTSGNFTATGTGQLAILLLDYDVAAKREFVTCTISGTAVASLTRALYGTSAVAHAASAKVAMMFTTGHYDLIADAIMTGWVIDKRTWTRTGDHTFTCPGTAADTFPIGTKVRYKQGGSYEYGTVITSSHSGGTITNTLATNSDYAMAASTVTDNYYSLAAAPQDFPAWFNYTATYAGFSAAPAASVNRFRIEGRQVTVMIYDSASGTSNANTFTITAPTTAATVTNMAWTTRSANGVNNSAYDDRVDVKLSSNSNSMVLLLNDSATGWTTSGGKACGFQLVYEI